MSRTSKKVLDERKETARKEDEHRRWMEAEIAKLQKQGPVTREQLEDLGLVPGPPLSPAMQFIINKLKGVPPERVDDEWKRIVCELVASDVSLDASMRKLLAGELRRLYFPNPQRERKRKQQLEAEVIQEVQHEFVRRGYTVIEAQEEIAKIYGLGSAANVIKKKQRAR